MIEDDEIFVPKPKRKSKKDDREFCPPTLGWTDDDGVFHSHNVRPSEYRVAHLILEHFQHTRENAEYRERWDNFFREDTRRQLKEADDRDEWKKAQDGPAPQRVRASGVKDCAREQAMSLMGFRPQMIGADAPHWAVSAAFGDTQHAMIESALSFCELTLRSEFNVRTEDGTLSGRVDALLNGEAFGLPNCILDVKTVNESAFKEGTWGPKVQGYIAQVSVYAYLTGSPVGSILLVDRGTGRMMDFCWDINPDFAERMLTRARGIVKYAKAKKLPKAEMKKDGKWSHQCFSFCKFRAICFRNEDSADWDAEGIGSVQKALNDGILPEEL